MSMSEFERFDVKVDDATTVVTPDPRGKDELQQQLIQCSRASYQAVRQNAQEDEIVQPFSNYSR